MVLQPAFPSDAKRKEYVDLVDAGIIDPTKVVRVALENAVSVASVLPLTEATMTEIPEPLKEHAMEPEMPNVKEASERAERMSAQGPENLDRTVHLAHGWLNELDDRLRWNNKARSYRLLTSVLHALRRLVAGKRSGRPRRPVARLLRRAYYDRWLPGTTLIKIHSVEELLLRVNEAFKHDPLAEPSLAVMTVFQLLSKKIVEGELKDHCDGLPWVGNIWPEPYMVPGTVRH